MVEPVHPFQRGELDGFNVPRRSASVNQSRFVLVPNTLDIDLELAIAAHARRNACRIALTPFVLVVRRLGDRQLRADRLDLMRHDARR